MAASALFNRYIWLVDLIYRTDGISRDEINRRWARSCYNINNEREIPERTFHRHKEAIKELFDIDIVCDRASGKLYRIGNRREIERDATRTWLLNTFSVNNLVNESQQLKSRILLEEIPSGQLFLAPLIEAMREEVTVQITYQGFFQDAPFTSEVEPLCVKVSKQRWYLLGKNIHNGKYKVYGLDRIHKLELTERKFQMPQGFDAEAYFSGSIGVIVGDGLEPEHVEIKAIYNQQDYIRSLPIHSSQQETRREKDYSIFTYYVKPTFDFIQEVMKYAPAVEVLKPAWLRERIRNIVGEMKGFYAD